MESNLKNSIKQNCVRFIALLAVSASCNCYAQTGPQPGDIYREYTWHADGDRDWRVTDDEAVKKFPRAADHLPNSILNLEVDDLKHAVRAEFMLDRWGGHRGTINKRLRFNERDWLSVPEISAVPKNIRPEMLMYQDNPIIRVPLDHLVEGKNTFEGDCDEAEGFGWGQWGIYSLVLRIYYDPNEKSDATEFDAKIVSLANGHSFGDDPLINVHADSKNGVSRIDLLASYDGYDEDGDGVYSGWHHSNFQLTRGQPNNLRDHVGTLWAKPYELTWNTHWVPDQKPKTTKLVARVQDSRGYWTVTEPIENLSLERSDVSVKLYRAKDVPEDFSVRVDETKTCRFDIPDSHDLSKATQSAVHFRSWHGSNHPHSPLKINEHEFAPEGKDHHYDYDLLEIPATALTSGENIFSTHSETEHHMLEVLWPGPAIVVRYEGENIAKKMPVEEVSKIEIDEAQYESRDHFVIKTEAATYWLDKNSGGLSRLLDRDGNDWINFRMKPWSDYPPAAAGAFRGIPNLIPNGPDEGFGHPGWDKATSEQDGETAIVVTSKSDKWQMRWDFHADDVKLTIEKTDPDWPYWFLYEGPIAGKWKPSNQYFATDTNDPRDKPHDFYKEDRLYENWQWAYFGDRDVPRVLTIVHEQPDDLIDTFSHLGNTKDGLDSPDGMVVFGFGRGRKGKEPLLSGNNSFRIRLLETEGHTVENYNAIKQHDLIRRR